MKVIRDKSFEELSRLAATEVLIRIQELAILKNSVNLGLVGGRSVSEIYRALTENTTISWKKVHFFLLDERYVPLDDKESNYSLIKKDLFDPLLENNLITTKNIHPINTHANNPNDAVFEYEKILDQYDGKIDVAIISAGENGHVAAIHPGMYFNTKGTYKYIEDSPKPPPKRITITPETLSETSSAILVFKGEGKKEALKKFLNKPEAKRTTPEKTMHLIKDLIVITDLKEE